LPTRRASDLAADAAASEPRAARVEDVHGDLEALVDRSQQVLLRDFYVLEEDRGRRARAQAHLVFVPAGADARHVAGDNEGTELPTRLFVAGLGEDGEKVGDSPVGDPDL